VKLLSLNFLWFGLTVQVLQVREIVAVLDLDVLFYPCPKNGPNFRPKVTQMGGKQQFPYMVRFFFSLFVSLFISTSKKEKSTYNLNGKLNQK
jgi:hypothetical protein